MNILITKVLVIIGLMVTLYINFLANSKPLNNISTGEISDKYNTLFTPSGFTFSIWGIIYLLLIGFSIYFALLSKESYDSGSYQLIGILFIATCLLNSTWLFAWHYDKILVCTLIMISFLAVLLLIVINIKEGETLTFITFSVYAGWISVALIANISILLFKYDLSFFMNNQYVWFYMILAVSLLIGLYMLIFKKNIYYFAVFIWAYIGIATKFIAK